MEHFNLQFFAEGEEEKITLTQKELDERVKNARAEGSRKSEKALLEELGFESKEAIKKIKEDVELTKKEKETLIAQIKEKETAITQRDTELSTYKAEKVALKLGVGVENVDNVIALVKGKGQELTEENIKLASEIFKGKSPFGTLGGKSQGNAETEAEAWLRKEGYKK